MSPDLVIDAPRIASALLAGVPGVLCFWLGTQWARRDKPKPVLWAWSRRPAGPLPPPMRSVQLMLPDLDEAARALSGYVWSPLHIQTALVVVEHHLNRVRLVMAQALEETNDRLKEKK